MDKEIERAFLDTITKALVSLPFDLKILLEAVADSDLERSMRELAAATVVHVITPKDGNVEAPLRFFEDVVQRPAVEEQVMVTPQEEVLLVTQPDQHEPDLQQAPPRRGGVLPQFPDRRGDEPRVPQVEARDEGLHR